MDVRITEAAEARVDELPRPIQDRVLRIFERLREWPEVSGAKPLAGNLAEHYRIRTGDYRILFRVEPRRILVLKVGHRRDFYE